MRKVQFVVKLRARLGALKDGSLDSRGLNVGTQAHMSPVLTSRMENAKLMPAHQGRSYVN